MTEPAPVIVENPDPLPVSVHETPDTPAQSEARTTKALAHVDADILRTEDNRRISGMWERTQQIIALAVVLTSLFVSAFLTIVTPDASATSFVFLASVANLVIGFYFGRTNHTKVGGDTQSRDGR